MKSKEKIDIIDEIDGLRNVADFMATCFQYTLLAQDVKFTEHKPNAVNGLVTLNDMIKEKYNELSKSVESLA